MNNDIINLCNQVCLSLSNSEYPHGSVARKNDIQLRIHILKRSLTEVGSVGALAVRSCIKRRFKNT